MAHLSASEFARAVGILARHHGLERLRERLVRLNALTSRRGLGSTAALADRLYMLTGGLRREVPATYAFGRLWQEMVGEKLGEEGEKKLEAAGAKVNACLTPRDEIAAGKEAELDAALAEYRKILAEAVGDEAAELDMLQKAVPAVAARLRHAQTTPPQPENPS